MELLFSFLLLGIGMVLLIKGADWFVDSASGLAKKLGIPTLVIGMTIVAFGTSAPEASVSISSALSGNSGIALGNVVGSNIFNLLVVVGASAFFRPVIINRDIMKRDYPYNLLATLVLGITLMDTILGVSDTNIVTRADGLLILAFFSVFMFYTVCSGMGGEKEDKEQAKKNTKPLYKLLPMLVIGLFSIVLGGNAVVRGASDIARGIGVSETLIGLTIVAVGTSLPELVTSIVATKKGEDDIAMGNVIGSNIFNILFIVGIGAVIKDMRVDMEIIIDTALLFVISILFYAFVFKKARVNKAGGAVMLATYTMYLTYTIIR